MFGTEELKTLKQNWRRNFHLPFCLPTQNVITVSNLWMFSEAIPWTKNFLSPTETSPETRRETLCDINCLTDDKLIATAAKKADFFLCTCNLSVSWWSPTGSRRDIVESILVCPFPVFFHAEAALSARSPWEATAAPQLFFPDAVPSHNLAHWLFFSFWQAGCFLFSFRV